MKSPAAPPPASRVTHVAARRSAGGQLASVPTVDAILLEERATAFAKRSIKTSAKLAGLKMAVSMCDLTTLEGKDTPGKVAYLCRKALQPAEAKYGVPSCAAVCVYPTMVKYARKFLCNVEPEARRYTPKVAAVATFDLQFSSNLSHWDSLLQTQLISLPLAPLSTG